MIAWICETPVSQEDCAALLDLDEAQILYMIYISSDLNYHGMSKVNAHTVSHGRRTGRNFLRRPFHKASSSTCDNFGLQKRGTGILVHMQGPGYAFPGTFTQSEEGLNGSKKVGSLLAILFQSNLFCMRIPSLR